MVGIGMGIGISGHMGRRPTLQRHYRHRHRHKWTYGKEADTEGIGIGIGISGHMGRKRTPQP